MQGFLRVFLKVPRDLRYLQRFIESSTEFQRNSEKIREIQGNLKGLRKFIYSFREF